VDGLDRIFRGREMFHGAQLSEALLDPSRQVQDPAWRLHAMGRQQSHQDIDDRG
jgi:hypothetical protein